MRFLTFYKSVETNVPPSPEKMARMGQFVEEMTRSGVVVATGGCIPSATGARVRLSGGKLTVTDGPFTESKELVAGYWIIQAKSLEEAVEWAKRAPSTPDQETEIEVRRFIEFDHEA